MKSAKIAAAPRRWCGRNAGLRPRLVLIVGIAMLAPGALAVLQAISSYNSSMRILEQNLAQAAQLSANEEDNMISASREILTSLAAHPDIRAGDGPACRRALQRAIGGLDQYAGAAVVNAQGRVHLRFGADARGRQRRRPRLVSRRHERRRLRRQRSGREPLARHAGASSPRCRWSTTKA